MKPFALLSISNFDGAGDNYRKASENAGILTDAKYLPNFDIDFDRYDGLMLCGGGDINPKIFGQESCGSNEPDHKRDEKELMAFSSFYKLGKPIFGICRGLQLINIALGGGLIQDLGTAPIHKMENGKDKFHEVYTNKGSFLEELFGENFTVNSAHHQGIGICTEDECDNLAKTLFVSAISFDGVIEAAENKDRSIIAVQWHPERMILDRTNLLYPDMSKLFEYYCDRLKINKR